MASFLDDLVGTAGGSPSTAFNVGAGAAASRYPSAYGSGSYPYSQDVIERYLQGTADERAEAKRQFDVKYEMDKRNADRNYQVAMMGARTQQDQARAQQEYQRAQTEIARERLAFDRETQAQEFGLKQAGLGYNVLNMAANLRGPQSYFQASNFARGVNAQPGTSTFLDALQKNTHLAGFGAQAGSPDAVSLSNILGGGGLGSQGAAGGAGASGDDQLVNQIHAIGAAGAGKLGNGALEQLSPTEYGLLMSGLEAPDSQGKAFDANTFLDQYRRSRIGQSAGGAGYRAA